MTAVRELMRADLRDWPPYSMAVEARSQAGTMLLDANENPFGTALHRYPDASQRELKKAVAALKGSTPENIVLGNGSDELIDLLLRVFCRAGHDKCAIFPPTFSMYERLARFNNVQVLKFPLNADFVPDPAPVRPCLQDPALKLVFLCSPNNPSGNLMPKKLIRDFCRESHGLVVLDEAYGDFAAEAGMLPELAQHPNLVILQTFSKAWGIAGARVGMCFAQPEIIAVLDALRPPFSIGSLNQEHCLRRLQQQSEVQQQCKLIIEQREFLAAQLSGLAAVRRVFPSRANFILVEFRDAAAVLDTLGQQSVYVRDCREDMANCLRITVGTAAENMFLLHLLGNLDDEETAVY